MKVLSLNIRHGGGPRVPAILEYIRTVAPDALVLSEFRNGETGEKIKAGVQEMGLRNLCSTPSPPQQNSVLIATRSTNSSLSLLPSTADQQRISGVRVQGINLIGVYFASGTKKKSLFDYLLTSFVDLDVPALLVGDFNTGLHRIDEARATFKCADQFQSLVSGAWVDAWRYKHGDLLREFTWHSSAGNGFRIDHALVTGRLLPLLSMCNYDHRTRETISDHSAIHVEFSL